jgi:hypothetical protein
MAVAMDKKTKKYHSLIKPVHTGTFVVQRRTGLNTSL